MLFGEVGTSWEPPVLAANGEAFGIFLLFTWSIHIHFNSSNLVLVLCHQPLWEVDLSMTHTTLTGKEIDGWRISHFGKPGSCSPPHDVFQVFIQMNIFGLSNWKQKSAQGKWVNLLSLKKILLKDLCMEKTEVKNYMDLKNEGCFKIKIKVALCSNTILQHLQTHLFTIFVGKDFCCRFQLWLINGKKSQDDLAGLCLIKSNKRSNKWANQEGTYVRAPCPGLWELGPCTLPNQTVSLRGICHELKDYLKRREPAALQFGCLKTSVTAGFPLVSKRVALPLVWAPDVPQPSAWQRPPQTALFLEVGLRLSKP